MLNLMHGFLLMSSSELIANNWARKIVERLDGTLLAAYPPGQNGDE
jgi:hypothetical protein